MRRKAGGREKEGRTEMQMNRKMGRLMSRRKRRERWRRKMGLMPMRRRWRWTMIRTGLAVRAFYHCKSEKLYYNARGLWNGASYDCILYFACPLRGVSLPR
jgi:hypothetical protein